MKNLVKVLLLNSFGFGVCAAAPSVKIASPTLGVVNNQPYIVGVNFTEPMQGFVLSGVEVVNGKALAMTNGNFKQYNLQIMPLATGPMAIRIPANVAVSKATNEANLASKILAIQSLNPALKPASNFDLTRFELNTPFPLGGGPHNTDIESGPLNGEPDRNTGYTNSPYFYTDPVSGSMNFFAPLNGATTPGSLYPRTELQEEEFLSWGFSAYTRNVMTASVAVTQMPPVKRKIVIGQIHSRGLVDKFGNVVQKKPLLKLIYDTNTTFHKQACNGCIRAQIRPTPLTAENAQNDIILATGIGLNKTFNYSIDLKNDGTLKITAANKQTVMQVSKSSNNTEGWGAQKLYFKAGVYLQENGTSPTLGGKAKFYYFNVKHQA